MSRHSEIDRIKRLNRVFETELRIAITSYGIDSEQAELVRKTQATHIVNNNIGTEDRFEVNMDFSHRPECKDVGIQYSVEPIDYKENNDIT